MKKISLFFAICFCLGTSFAFGNNIDEFSSAISSNEAFLNNITISDALFRRVDIMFSKDKLNYRRLPFSIDPFVNGEVNPNQKIIKNKKPVQNFHNIAWFLPMLTYQRAGYTGMSRVNNRLISGTVGFDFPFVYLGDKTDKDWILVPTVFIGYNGSREGYEDLKINRDTLTFGGMATFKKEDYLLSFQTFLTNGGNVLDSSRNEGEDAYHAFTFSMSAKGSRNFLINNNTLLQLSVMAIYNYLNLGDIETNSSVIHTQSNHQMLISPSIRVMKEYNGWYPYASLGLFINTIQMGRSYANDEGLSRHRLKHYGELSLGLENTFLENWSGYAQVSGYAGGAVGASVQIGIRGYITDVNRKR